MRDYVVTLNPDIFVYVYADSFSAESTSRYVGNVYFFVKSKVVASFSRKDVLEIEQILDDDSLKKVLYC